MEELRLWIKDVGFPIAVAVLAMYALYKLFLMKEEDRANFTKTIEQMSAKSNVALEKNTEATITLAKSQKETNDWWKQFGSDPFKNDCALSKAQADLEASKVILTAEEKAIFLEQRAREARAKVEATH